jgi:ABC-type glycerol-3-phosphate transport system substrate-binding protein
MRRSILALVLLTGLAACGAEPIWAPEEDVQRAAYSTNEPPSLTLVTVISNSNGSGGHTGLVINASQRVVFDPAGTWYHPYSPERNDLHYGMTDQLVDHYYDYHARETYHVVTQTVEVPAEVAEAAFRAAASYGAVPKAMCARSTSDILRRLPGFDGVPGTMNPKRIMAAFDQMPGVRRSVVYDDSPDDNTALLGAVDVAQAAR